MNTQESPAQESATNTGDASAKDQPASKEEPIPPAAAPAPPSSRSRQPWSRLQSAKNRLNALESPSQPQPREDGPSSKGGSLPKDDDDDASTLNETTDDEVTVQDSEHSQDKNEPDSRTPPTKSPEREDNTAILSPMSVDKAAEDATNLLRLDLEAILWTLVYRVIHLEHQQDFYPEKYEKVQNVAVNVGQKLRNMHCDMKQRPEGAPAEQSGTEKAQTPTDAKPGNIEIAMGQTPIGKKSRTTKIMAAQLPEQIAQVTLVLKAFQAQSPNTVEARSVWIRDFHKFASRHVHLLQDHAEAIMVAENVSRMKKYAIASCVQEMFSVLTSLDKKEKAIRSAIPEAKAAELPTAPKAIPGQTPEETQERLTQAIQRTQKLKALRCTLTQVPDLAEDTELPVALKLKAAATAEALRRARNSLGKAFQERGFEAAETLEVFKLAEAVITERLNVTGVAVEDPAAGREHAGPTYPWGIFQELEETAKTTMNHEVSMAQLGFEKREAHLRDATGAHLRSKEIKLLLVSITAQCWNMALDLIKQSMQEGPSV